MAPHSSTFAWKVPWTEEPGGLQSMVSLESDTTEWLHFHFSLSCIGEGNGNPLQCSCLENPRDGEAWWAAVYGVAQNWTRLKRLSSSSSSSSSKIITMASQFYLWNSSQTQILLSITSVTAHLVQVPSTSCLYAWEGLPGCLPVLPLPLTPKSQRDLI